MFYKKKQVIDSKKLAYFKGILKAEEIKSPLLNFNSLENRHST